MLKTPQIIDGSGFQELYAWTASHFQNYWSLGLQQPLTHLDSLTQFTQDHDSFLSFSISYFELSAQKNIFRKLTGQRWYREDKAGRVKTLFPFFHNSEETRTIISLRLLNNSVLKNEV